MDGSMRIELCGRLRFAVGAEERADALHGRQGRILFAYLVLHRAQPVHRDALVEALWPSASTAPGPAALAPVLSRLRRALEPARIEGRESLQLVLPPGSLVDVEVAAQRLAQARAALREGDAATAVAAAGEAASLAAPGLLPGYDPEWLAAPRTELEELRVEALEIGAHAGLRLGGEALPEAEQAARAAVAAAPFRESARAALITVLAQRGNTAEAVRAYEELRVLLREELGTVPGPELVALHERLVSGAGQAVPGTTAAPHAPSAAARTAPAVEPASAAPAADLEEREPELAQIATALGRVGAGTGGVLLFEGPAGIGKTRLLGVVRERAAAAGMEVLQARAGVLEREFGFGVVRQLFAAHADRVDGAAAPARAALGGADAAPGETSFTVLDGLFHLTAALATQRPLVLCVDDLQWSDPASLRFAAYLTRRVAELPVLLVATVRTGEPGTDELLLGEVEQDPATVAAWPRPLSAEATTRLVRSRLGADADERFAAACQEVTAGNPLLLRQLLTALAAEGVVPDAAHAQAVRAIGPRAVSRTVLLRLARLAPPAGRVAQAVAVLGEQPGLAAIARFAETGESAAATAIEALTRAEILREDEPLGFVHPLVRDAVYTEQPAARRGLEHARAARLLADLGASPERVAAQLLLTPPRADAWVVERLREAAEVAVERGAPDTALILLERAQAEPPAPEQRTRLALELGAAAEFVRGSAAIEPLRRAYEGLTDPVARSGCALMLARMLLFMESPGDAITFIDAAQAELPEEYEDLHLAFVALRIVAVFFGVADPAELQRLETWRAGPRSGGPGARTLTAITALSTAISSGPAVEAAALARESLEDDILLGFDRGLFCVGPATTIAMHEPADGNDIWVAIRAFAGRRGSVLDAVGADLWGGLTHIWTGDLREATAMLEHAYEGEALFGSSMSAHMGYTPGFLALAWLERGDRERAWEALRRTGDHVGPSDGERWWMTSHAELLLLDGRLDEAAAVAEQLAGTRPEQTHPLWSPWRSLKARALAAAGEGEQARALASDELALARLSGAPWIVGRALRLVGELSGPGDGTALLRDAVALLDGTSARLERAKAHAALGDALAGSDPAAAAAARATALTLAHQCGAEGLAARLQSAGTGVPATG